MDLRHRVRAYIREQQLIAAGDHLVVGLSGGADSVCLLLLLDSLAEEMQFTLEAVHVHHGIRGEEAERDASFAEAMCRERGVPFTLYRRDVPALAEQWKLSLEEAGRRVRYMCFEERAQGCDNTRIAVAHHMDDQAETVLLNLCRGSGLRGIGAMAPKNRRLIRPLLSVRRAEIESELRRIGQSWCEDSTNGETGYTRNRIRNTVLPELCGGVNARAVEHLAAAAEQARQLDVWLEQMAGQWIAEHVMAEDRSFKTADLADCPAPLRGRILLRLLEQTAGASRDLGSRHLRALEELVLGEKGGTLDLPYGVRAIRAGSRVRITAEKERVDFGPWALLGETDREETVLFAEDSGRGECAFEAFRLTWKLSERGEGKIPEKEYTKWFDYDRIRGAVRIRTRRSEDALALSGVGHKTLRRYMIDAHIPADVRDRVPVLADEEQVLWVIGGRMSAEYQVTEATDRILEVTITSIEGNRKNHE